MQQAVTRCYLATKAGGDEKSLIINAVGRDRLGLVSEITGYVISEGGNVGESQAAKLGNYFSLMMLVDVPENNLDALKHRLKSMTDMNATVFEATGDDSSGVMHQEVGYSGYFTLEGADHPGIVHKMTTALAAHGLSIDKLHTDQEIAPYGGSVLFKMKGIATATAPLAQSFDAIKIKEELADLGDSLNCEVDIEEVVDAHYEGSFYAG
eukprot:CAMPEP_0172439018 /NCGR_PEP_ID=MMETSP1065-20121228/133_1 /TAXON_ID=265537 /ORGANISM="Amphiprora paludosa, Strain CCMP125" /LENGTH=208 /DNA_ID=CAMNT_0013187639 /DNA_START=132 /DNA_END=758 /DNA_ORIENTATION=-